jgi:hypothetical protein
MQNQEAAVKCFALNLMLLSCVAASAIAQPADFRPSPHFEGRSIPRPPEQDAVWAPPQTSLPGDFIEATRTLFAQGLADPRGCKYRDIEIGTGSCWQGDAGVAATRGWVLPADDDSEQQFAVAWNGLVYPVVTVGKEADVRTDVLAAIEARGETRPPVGSASGRAIPERIGTSHESILPLKACLLLRLGEGELAQRMWTLATPAQPAPENRDPYLPLARDWTWCIFDRALGAHMRGDDNLALASCEQLLPLAAAVEKEAAWRELPRPLSVNDADGPMPYLQFLGQLDELVADQRRRAEARRAGDQPPVIADDATFQSLPVDELVRQLENVAGRQRSQPGGVEFSIEPILQALIAKGPEAVEPLLEALESDARLTRSVSYHRDFSRHRNVLGVSRAAASALTTIMQVRSFRADSWDETGRRALARQFREYWQDHGDEPVEERWYRVLQDDAATIDQWLEAAEKIVAASRTRQGDGTLKFDSTKMAGERLRAHASPSVTELMVQRIDELAPPVTRPTSNDLRQLHDACRIAFHLAKWDVDGALPTLARLSDACRDQFDNAPRTIYGSTRNGLAANYSRLILPLGKAGDDEVIREYAAWIRTVDPQAVQDYVEIGRNRHNVFQPLIEFADHPAIQESADWLFEDERSPWKVLLAPGKSVAGFYVKGILTSDLIRLAGFRKQLLRQLQDERPIGVAEVRGERNVQVRVEQLWTSGGTVPRGAPKLPPVGTQSPIRVCDLHAYILSTRQGAPPFSLFWTETDRDAALLKYRRFVSGFGGQ